MSDRVKRLYRVIAYWPGGITRRDYQSRTAAVHHAEVLRETLVPVAPIKVTVTMSDPVTWPNDGTP